MPTAHVPRPRRPPLILRSIALVLGCWALTGAPAYAAPVSVDLLAVATIGQTITNITHWIVGLLAGVATMFLTIGGLRYLMAGGDPGEVEKAKGALKSACQGYMLALLAPIIVGVLKSLVGG